MSQLFGYWRRCHPIKFIAFSVVAMLSALLNRWRRTVGKTSLPLPKRVVHDELTSDIKNDFKGI